VSAPTPQQIRFSRKVNAAVDVFAIAHAPGAITPELHSRVFDALTEDDPNLPPDALGRMLERFPAATFDLGQLPIPMIPGNPQSN
jgi:hypothetical protein